MANRTVNYANSVHGTNPQYLIEKIVRTRIIESKYWKENCTLLNSALVLEKAVDDLRYIGGVYGGHVKPTPFLCLALKLLQIQPKKEIIYLYLDQTDFKYLRALGAFYLRLVGSAIEVYSRLEPLLRDYRKLRMIDRMHNFSLIHMDELIDNLLNEQRIFDIILPRLTKRQVLESNGDLEPYKSDLEEQNLIPTQLIKEKAEQSKASRLTDRYTDEGREGHRDRRHDGHRERHRERHHDRHEGRHRSRSGGRSRDRGGPYEDEHHDGRRDASSSRSSPSVYQAYKGRFRREEIDNENAIRAKVGLQPLK